MPLLFTVANTGKVSLTLQLLGRTPAADFRVSDLRGRTVWTRLRGQTLLGALRLFPLGGGKHLSFRQVWDQRDDTGTRVSPGDYLIRGVLMTDDAQGLASPPMKLRIGR